MNTVKILAAAILCSFALSTFSPAMAYNDTENYWQCNNRVGGSWNFGRAPYACDVNAFGDESYITSFMAPTVFDDTVGITEERSRYMDAMYPVVRETAEYYIKLRKPGVSAAEVNAWQHAIYAIAHQESFWSHYRKATDNRLKMMRGDYGHGHGMMQLDDRWHFVAINEGKGWNLTDNLIYALEEYYNGWQNAPSASCLSSSTNWRNRARAAYSAYNGGASKICRWTNPDDTWARNDINFASKYDNQSWNSYISNPEADPQVNVSCLIEGGEVCPIGQLSDDWQNKLMLMSDSSACVFNEGEIYCVSDVRDSACLHSTVPYPEGETISVEINEIADYTRHNLDRHESCQISNLHKVGSFINLQKSINVRATPGGSLVTTSSIYTTYQVLDFEVRDVERMKRYYLIQHDGQKGYIYAGDKNDNESWAISTTATENAKIIATNQDWVKIVPSALNMRATPGGALITSIPKDTALQVIDYVVKGDTNKVYTKVYYNNSYGYLYSGQILPTSSLSSWLKLDLNYIPPARTGRGADNLWWVWLKTCASSSCTNADTYFIGKVLEDYCSGGVCGWTTDTFEEIESDNGWVRIKVDRNGGSGWVLESNVKWD